MNKGGYSKAEALMPDIRSKTLTADPGIKEVRMGRRISSCMLLVLCGFIAVLGNSANVGLDLTYIVSVEDPGSHKAHITIEIDNTSPLRSLSLFIKSTHILRYVTTACWHPSEGCPSIVYDSHVSNFVAHDHQGNSLRVQTYNYENENAEFVNEKRININHSPSITVDYDVTVLSPWECKPGIVNMTSYLGGEYGIINDIFFFYRPDVNASWPGGRRTQVHAIRIVFRLPSGWKAISIWGGDSNDFLITSPTSFCERCTDRPRPGSFCAEGSFLGLAPFRVFAKHIGATEVLAAIVDKQEIPAEAIANLVFYSFERIHNLLGDYPGSRFVSFTISDFAEEISGPAASRNIVWSPRLRSSVVRNYRLDDEGWLLYPDEILWEWCEALGFVGQGQGEDERKGYWFTDGAIVNTYYKIPLEFGYTTLSDYYGEYVRCLRLYEEEGSHLWPLLGLALDREIQARTGGTKDLQDVLAVLHRRVRGRSYSNLDIQAALCEVTGDWFSDFFNKYVYRPGLPPLEVLEEYKRYPDLEIKSEWVEYEITESGTIFVHVPVANYGGMEAVANVEFYQGFPWLNGELISSEVVTIPAGGRAAAEMSFTPVQQGIPVTVFVQLTNVVPGDIDTRTLRKLVFTINPRNLSG